MYPERLLRLGFTLGEVAYGVVVNTRLRWSNPRRKNCTMNSKLLTIAIPTYNRKQSLLDVLKGIEPQGHYDQYEIVVSNNCSEYDVDEWLSRNLSKEFRGLINIYNRPYNIGGSANVSFTYQLCRTRWMWLLSDDDKVMPNAISTILSDIKKMPEIAHIKYSIQGYYPLPDRLCKSFGEVLDVFVARNVQAGYGQFVFMSNNVINLEKMRTYIGLAPQYAHSAIPQLIPSVFAIKKDHVPWKVSSQCITNYEPIRTYRTIDAKLDFANIQLIDADFSEEELVKIRKMFSGFKGIRNDVEAMLGSGSSIRARLMFYRLWTGCFPLFSIRGIAFYIYYHLKALLGKNTWHRG